MQTERLHPIGIQSEPRGGKRGTAKGHQRQRVKLPAADVLLLSNGLGSMILGFLSIAIYLFTLYANR